MSARFTKLTLANWRNFKRVELPLGPRAFIVGPNASGKSNLLDAFRFLRDIAAPGGSLVNAVKDRRGIKHIRSLHAGRNGDIRVEVEIEIDEDPALWTYALEIAGGDGKKKPLRVESERVIHGDEELLFRRASDEDERLLQQTYLEQSSQRLAFEPLVAALSGIVHIQMVSQLARPEEPSKRDAPDFDLIEQLASLSETQQIRALRRIERLLRIAVPKFSDLRLNRDESGRPHLEARYEHWRLREGWQNEQEFSDGTHRLIGVFWAIDQGTAPLLIEEPELMLHREVIRQLPRLFARASQRTGRQILVSTHAEEILADRGIDLSEIVILDPSESDTRVFLGSERPELIAAAKAGVRLGPLVTSLTKPQKIEQLSLPGSTARL